MKQFTTPDQTAKLIELGFDKPKNERWVPDVANESTPSIQNIVKRQDYSIGELIEMLEEVASVVIAYSYQKRGYYVRVIIPKRIGGGIYRIRQKELVDALYDMIIKLKEEEVI